MSTIPDKVRDAISHAIKAGIAAGRHSGTVRIDNPECVTYPCQCSGEKYCCSCIPLLEGACIHFCQADCLNFDYDVCGENALCFNCDNETDCVACCENGGYWCDYSG